MGYKEKVPKGKTKFCFVINSIRKLPHCIGALHEWQTHNGLLFPQICCEMLGNKLDISQLNSLPNSRYFKIRILYR